jgi:hypothetical protein
VPYSRAEQLALQWTSGMRPLWSTDGVPVEDAEHVHEAELNEHDLTRDVLEAELRDVHARIVQTTILNGRARSTHSSLVAEDVDVLCQVSIDLSMMDTFERVVALHEELNAEVLAQHGEPVAFATTLISAMACDTVESVSRDRRQRRSHYSSPVVRRWIDDAVVSV